MESAIVNKYMKLLEPLAIEVKLELLSRLSASLKKNFTPTPTEKEKLLNELSGAWKDMGGGIVEEIMNARSISNRDINLD